MSREQYVSMATWQRLVGNAVTAALSGDWCEAASTAQDATRKALLPLSPGRRRRAEGARQDRERRQTTARLAKLEMFQRVTAGPRPLLDVLESSSDLRQVSTQLDISEEEASAVLDMRLRDLTPLGRQALAREVEAARRRLEEA